MRRFVQSMLAIVLCLMVAGSIGPLYVIAAIVATVIALSSGMYITLAMGLGFVWPLLVYAWVVYVTRGASRRAAERAAGPATTGRSEAFLGPETILPGIEDPK
jgi:hypothetical protein